jgi:zinc transport system ATP-binding protein
VLDTKANPQISATSATESSAVEIDNVGYTYPGAEQPALDRISLRVGAGERLGILGPNGGGKSTLLRIILGLIHGHSGTVRVFGRSPQQARREGLVGYVAQHPELELDLPLSVREAVTLGASWRTSPFRRIPADVMRRVDEMIEIVGASPFADRPIGKLSGGQLQRALIARALAARVRILALDEPTVGIDAAGQAKFAELLDRVHKELGLTILIITHDLRAIVAGSDRVACLARRLHSHTSPQGLTPQILAELFTHDVAGLAGIGGALAGMHVHAHAAGEPCTDPAHTQAAPSPPVSVSISASRPKPSAKGDPRA